MSNGSNWQEVIEGQPMKRTRAEIILDAALYETPCRYCAKKILHGGSKQSRRRFTRDCMNANIKPICAACKRVERSLKTSGLFGQESIQYERKPQHGGSR